MVQGGGAASPPYKICGEAVPQPCTRFSIPMLQNAKGNIMETVDIKNISFNEKGLVPAIVQDARSGEILKISNMNQESFQKNIKK